MSASKNAHLFMMIRPSGKNRHGPVDLLHEDEADHLMRKRHLRHRNLFMSRPVHLLRKAVRAADDEHQALVDRIIFRFM